MTIKNLKRVICLSLAALCTAGSTAADQFVSFTHGDILLNRTDTVRISIDPADYVGVRYAAENLQTDIGKVCGSKVVLSDTDLSSLSDSDPSIIVGTIGHSAAIDRLVKKGLIDGKQLKGKWEKFIITLAEGKLVIAGSDKRGTIYGIYELSRQIGVSPWYDWADVPIEHHDSIFVLKGTYTDGEPAVRYRGIFLNDEAPCLTSWVKNTYGTDYGDHRFYRRVFELVLRLRGNMMWPAMWGWAFYADDPENEKTADEMGIIMGTSHHEPMARNHQEYARERGKWGAWNYQKNKTGLQQFFREGIERMKGTEQIVTIGMRGDGDEAMSEDADIRLMTDIISDQRKIISEVTGKKASETPQVWALYKEVLDYYDKGLKVPDDVTLLLCDDNWGNLRRVPTARDRDRKGGWGLYYHVDYVGAPRNSKLLNVTPVQNMWEQLSLAYAHGIDRLWILNVGDLKPMEYPINQFLDMAWNPGQYTAEHITDHTRRFCVQQFGESQADEAARLLNLTCKLAGRCTPELLDKDTYDLQSGEWEKVVGQYLRLEADALRQFACLPDAYRDAYRQIVLFPVELMSNLHQMYYAQAQNHALYRLSDPRANIWADECERLFRRDSLITDYYNHKMSRGKWNGMMTQKHIGYTQWNDNFPHDTCPRLYRVETPSVVEARDTLVEFEAAHFYSKTDAEAVWTEIPHMGKSLSAMTLMPQTASVEGASITYKFRMQGTDKVRIHVVTKSTLDYLNKGGLTYSVSVDGQQPVLVNFNGRLNEQPENIYSLYYPTIASRVVTSTVDTNIDGTADTVHTVTITPHDPAIMFEKIIVDGRSGRKKISVL